MQTCRKYFKWFLQRLLFYTKLTNPWFQRIGSKRKLFFLILTIIYIKTHPSFSNTGSVSDGGAILWSPVEIASRKFLTASTCFSVQNFLYSSPVYCSLLGCCADRELTRLPRDCIVLEISVSVLFVCSSCNKKVEDVQLIPLFSYKLCFLLGSIV